MTSLIRTIQLALKSLMLHKLRSGLTMLGIVFGVFSVIAMLAIGEGASKQAQDQVLALGATNIIVKSEKPPKETAGAQSANSFVLRYGLLRADYDLLSKTIPTIEQAIPFRELKNPVDISTVSELSNCWLYSRISRCESPGTCTGPFHLGQGPS